MIVDKQKVMSSEDKEDFDYVMESLFRIYHSRLEKDEPQKKADVRSIRVIIDQLLEIDESIVFTSKETNGYVPVVAWAQDFVYAASERSRLLRIVLRLCLGKYAFREFLGMVEALQRIGYINSDLRNMNYMGYNCENQEYHGDFTPLDWLNLATEADKALPRKEINDKNL